jgi:hypothetical protein
MKRIPSLFRRARALCAAALLAGASAAAAQPEELRAERDDLVARRRDADLDRVNPGIGFGWFALSDVPIGGGADRTASAPVLGIRWWMGAPLGPFRTWGLDLGFGVGRSSRQDSPEDVTRTALLLHGGLPLVVSATRHVAIEFIPELNLGLATGQEANGTDVSGSILELGVRAGAEIFFGFVGLPQLALEGSVGLSLRRENRTQQPTGGAERSVVTTTFGTSVQNQPWDLFRTSVAARYYFYRARLLVRFPRDAAGPDLEGDTAPGGPCFWPPGGAPRRT